jgi:hypothetical protein
MTVGDLMVIGVNIKWYEDEVGGSALPLSTLITKSEYWAAQSSGDCESERVKVTIVSECYDPYGTMFPFVHTGDPYFDNQFVTTAKLYLLPPDAVSDKIGYTRKQTYVHAMRVTHYNCGGGDSQIDEAPKYPGIVGATNNPGLPIRWGEEPLYPTNSGPIDNTPAGSGCPEVPVGKYIFKDVAPGESVMEIARPGFLSRYCKITIKATEYLGHREILAGDVNNSLVIDESDLSVIFPKVNKTYGSPLYDWKCDFNGDGRVNAADVEKIHTFSSANRFIYQETTDDLK